MDHTVIIKKYVNRRLYDTEKSVYVTLAQVADYIHEGRVVRIIDAKTREDVTDFILTQIVLEQAKNKKALLPAPVLHMIIRYGDNLLGEFFEKYFFQIFQNFVAQKQAVDTQFQKWLKMGTNRSQAVEKGFTEMNPFHSFFDSFGRGTKKDDEK